MSSVYSLKDYMKEGNRIQDAIDEIIIEAEGMAAITILFEAESYYLKDFQRIFTDSIAHDDGCGDINQKDCHIILKNIKNLTLKGQVDGEGNPATTLVGYNGAISQAALPTILWAEKCKNLIIKNISFTREPECASAGKIIDIDKDKITVEVFPGLPCNDGMAAYCMNRFDLDQSKLVGASITYGFGFDTRFKKIAHNKLTIESSQIANEVHVGEGLSWHQSGKTDFQVFFGECDNLEFYNIRVYNSNSFAILTENCKNIKAQRLLIKPKGYQLFTGSRDGWKIYRCCGNIILKDCHIEGVRMDGQNVHSNFMTVQEILSDNEIIFACKYAPITLRENSEVEFYNGTEITSLCMSQWCFNGKDRAKAKVQQGIDQSVGILGPMNNITLYRLKFKAKLPGFVKEGTLMTPVCWEPDHYVCENTTFKNIAGAGHLLRCDNVEIRKCKYINIMNAGILMGAEFDTHCEGGHVINAKIEDCVFENCGFKPRYGEYGCGCIAVKSQGFSGMYNKNISIEGNCFKDSQRAVEINDADGVVLSGNQFYNIGEKYKIGIQVSLGIFDASGSSATLT